MKKLIVLILILLISGTITVFADQGTKETPEKSIFQELSDGLSEFGKFEGEKKPFSAIFQRSSDYIEETSPVAKQKSLREDEEELKKRRGQSE